MLVFECHNQPVLLAFWLLLMGLLSYLAGSVMGAHMIGRMHQVDLRQQGSGNLGATNALRTLGTKAGLSVLLIDVFKGMFTVFFVMAFTLLVARWYDVKQNMYVCFGGNMINITDVLVVVAGLGVLLGHMFSLFEQGRGGKGVATYFGVMLALAVMLQSWSLLLVPLGTLVLVVAITGYVSLGSMLSALVNAVVTMTAGVSGVSLLALLAALLIVFKHRANIVRLLAGNESRLSKNLLAVISKAKA